MPDNIKEKIENKIIDWIAFYSDGRLIAGKPEVGADLVVQRKGDYSGKKIFLNVKISENLPENNESFPEDYYSLFISFDFVKQEVGEKVWLFPKFKEQIDRKTFINFLIQKLITENKASPHEGFKRKFF